MFTEQCVPEHTRMLMQNETLIIEKTTVLLLL